MELICTEQYNDIRFSLEPGDSTSKVPYLTDEFKKSLLKDYPEKFKLQDKKSSDSELDITAKEDTLGKKITKK